MELADEADGDDWAPAANGGAAALTAAAAGPSFEQSLALEEAAALDAEWRAQAAAADEVERRLAEA